MHPRQCPPLIYRRILSKITDTLSSAKSPSLRAGTSELPRMLAPIIAELSQCADAYTTLLNSGASKPLSDADRNDAASLGARIQQTDRLVCGLLLDEVCGYVQSTEKAYAELEGKREASAVLEAGFMRDDLVKLRKLVGLVGLMVTKKAAVRIRSLKEGVKKSMTRRARKRGNVCLGKKGPRPVPVRDLGRAYIAIPVRDDALERTAVDTREWLLNSWLLLPPWVERGDDANRHLCNLEGEEQRGQLGSEAPGVAIHIAASPRSQSAPCIHTIFPRNNIDNVARAALAVAGEAAEMEADDGKALNAGLSSLLPSPGDVKEGRGGKSLAQAQDEVVREAEMWWRTRDFFAAWKG
jgi:hypothetical protein